MINRNNDKEGDFWSANFILQTKMIYRKYDKRALISSNLNGFSQKIEWSDASLSALFSVRILNTVRLVFLVCLTGSHWEFRCILFNYAVAMENVKNNFNYSSGPESTTKTPKSGLLVTKLYPRNENDKSQ